MKNRMKGIMIVSACFVLSAMVLSKQSTAYASAQEKSEIATGYRLMVDGTSWGVVADKEALDQMLEDYKMNTLKSVDGEIALQSAEFTQQVEVNEVEAEVNSFITVEKIKEKIETNETSEVSYTVKKGDNIWSIAKTYRVSTETIRQLNPGLNLEKIVAGQKIIFQPKDAVIDVVTSLETTVVKPVAFKTEYVNDATLLKGKTVVAQKGVAGSKKITYDVLMVNGYVSTSKAIKEVIVTAPVNTIVKVGTKVVVVPKPVVRSVSRTAIRNYGVVTGRLSSDFGYRSDPFTGLRTFHTGIDIAASYGTSVYAYAGGKVVVSTSNSVRGNYVTIDHGNGLQTSYLHLSSRLVKVGDVVSSRQLIGKVGSTGSATGNHLHFTVTKNGTLVSPWNYV